MAPIKTIPATNRIDLPTLVIYCPIIWDYSTQRVPVSDLSRDAIISSVATGEWDSLIKVIASDTATGRCWDCSQEIAREALAQAIDRYGNRAIPRACLEFAEEMLGINTTRSFIYAAA